MTGFQTRTHCTDSPFQSRFLLISCTLIALGLTVTAQGSLIPTVFVDTPTELVVVWDWDEFNAGGAQIADLDIPPLVNWDVTLTTTPAGPIPTWTVEIDVFHVTNPHPGDVGGGGIATLTKIFDDDQFLGAPVPPNVFAIVSHPAIGHIDAYEMQVFHSLNGTTNVIKLTGKHIPGPGALSLLGLAGLAVRRRRRQRHPSPRTQPHWMP